MQCPLHGEAGFDGTPTGCKICHDGGLIVIQTDLDHAPGIIEAMEGAGHKLVPFSSKAILAFIAK